MAVSLQDQIALFEQLAAGTHFVLDGEDSFKKQFNILAIAKGWKGGDENWNKYWREMFKEDYPYGQNRSHSVAAMNGDKADRVGVALRRGSDSETDWENVSNSTDYIVITLRENPTSPESVTSSSETRGEANASSRSTVNPMRAIKTRTRNERFTEEWKSFLGRFKSKLEGLQFLCKIVGIEPIPASVTKCKEALKKVLINIINLLNHVRDPENCHLIKFTSYSAFMSYTRMNGHRLRLQEAKQDEIIKVLLRKVR